MAENPYSAVYGGAGTGFINTVTKSGTDTFHGDAFYYNRNSGTGANDAVDKGAGRRTPLNVLQQFGADLGGPIARHKAWFYFDYEQQRQRQPISVVNGGYASLNETNFGVPAGTALPPPNGPFATPSSFSSVPSPSDPNYPVYLQQVSNALNAFLSNLRERRRRRDDLVFFPKLDWQPTLNDHLTFVYNYNKFNSPGGTFTFNPVGSFGTEALPNNFVRDHHSTIHWTHSFASDVLNDLHLSYLRDEQIATPSGLINPKLSTVYNFGRGFFALGNPTFAIGDTREYQWEFGEQLNWVRGRHNLKFGIDFSRALITDFFPGNFQGTYFFFTSPNDLSNFALGHYSFFTENSGNPAFPFRVPYYGFYAQDKFQVRHNLTLDLGLREDFQVYSQPRGNPAFSLTGQFPNRYQRLAPRLGFAYQPFSKTVVRGGFGMFYTLFNGINYESSVIANGLPSQQASIFRPFNRSLAPNQQSPTFPQSLPSSTPGFSASSNISLVDPHFRTPYVLESSLELQRQIFAGTTVTIGTLWTHGVHLIASSAYDMNLCLSAVGSCATPLVGATTTYTVCPSTAVNPSTQVLNPTLCVGPTFTAPTLDSGLLTEGQISPTFGQINAHISPGTNNYNSVYVEIQRRMSHGLALLTSYTFSKTLQSGMDFNNQFDFRNTHGPSLLDQRHRLSVAAVYSPSVSGLSQPWARDLLENWTVSTTMQFNSGRPYTGILNTACTSSTLSFNNCDGSSDVLNDSAVSESTGNTAAGIAGSGPTPGIGLNAFYGPWINEVDLGVARSFHFGERQSITLWAQAFNLLNHPNFFVQNANGINATQYDPIGTNCGDGSTAAQTCYLVPDSGFKTLQSIDELNGPRIFQFAFRYQF